MNIQEYISSGIVESYVLGLASPEESAEFEMMCAKHHEVRAARDAFELQLEQAAVANGAAVPRHLKSKIFGEIEIESENAGPRKVVAEPEVEETGRFVNMRFWKMAAAASIILLLGSAVLNFYFYNRYNKYKSDYSELLASQSQTAKNYESKIASYEEAMGIMKDTAMYMVRMKGMPNHENNAATVFWDTRTKDVYLMVNNLPKPSAGKQYQLWAQVGDKMVDAGLLDWNEAGAMLHMKNVPTASAFAISLEKEGGSQEPDLTAVVVLGKV